MQGHHSRVLIRPPAAVDFEVEVPGSKSITNRALIAASLAKGVSRLRTASFSGDSLLLAASLKPIGVSIREDAKRAVLEVEGISGNFQSKAEHFFLGNAGTSLRFLTALLCLGNGKYLVDGDERMRQRPIQGLVDALNVLGAKVHCVHNNGCPPVEIDAAGLRGGRVVLDGRTSSQFISALLLAVPYAHEEVILEIEGDVTSKPYIAMTLDVMKEFGVSVEREGYRVFSVKSGQYYKPRDYIVAGDAASANYFFAMAAVMEGRIRVHGLGNEVTQGELHFLDVLEQMGCVVKRGADFIEVIGRPLRGVEVDMNDAPDSVPTLACVALFANGATRIRNVANLRLKETDRLAALERELTKLGAKARVSADAIEITPAPRTTAAEIETYNDHRMVMSFAVAACRIDGLVIRNPACVSKSFPDFFSLLERLGFEV